MESKTITVKLKKEGEKSFNEVQLTVGLTLLEALKNFMGIKAYCGGFAACATCAVLISPTQDEEVSMAELDALEMLPIRYMNSRLSCQIFVTKKLENAEIIVMRDSLQD